MSLDVDQLVLADGRRISYIRLAPSSQAEMKSVAGQSRIDVAWGLSVRDARRQGGCAA